ncbi:unnamed protein product [Cuscuta europaea]|nr:unnamed protein product [Cuscuta europaea]
MLNLSMRGGKAQTQCYSRGGRTGARLLMATTSQTPNAPQSHELHTTPQTTGPSSTQPVVPPVASTPTQTPRVVTCAPITQNTSESEVRNESVASQNITFGGKGPNGRTWIGVQDNQNILSGTQGLLP